LTFWIYLFAGFMREVSTIVELKIRVEQTTKKTSRSRFVVLREMLFEVIF
jgi:hypothetical protein